MKSENQKSVSTATDPPTPLAAKGVFSAISRTTMKTASLPFLLLP